MKMRVDELREARLEREVEKLREAAQAAADSRLRVEAARRVAAFIGR